MALVTGNFLRREPPPLSESEFTKLMLERGYVEWGESDKKDSGPTVARPLTVGPEHTVGPGVTPEVDPLAGRPAPGSASRTKVERSETAALRSASPESYLSLKDMALRMTGKTRKR